MSLKVTESDALKLAELDEGSDDCIIKELGKLFINGVPGDIEAINLNLQRREFEKIRKDAHKLKSSSGNLRALRFSAICQNVELLSNSTFESEAPLIIEKLKQEFKRVEKALQEEIETRYLV
jgi:HPt (histidine-containing phosphotransfer) domain-containing protein